MRTITLSDHTKTMAERAAQSRETSYQQQVHAYEGAMSARIQKVRERKGRLQDAWRARQWLRVIQHVVVLCAFPLPSVPPVPKMEAVSHEERRWTSGGEGEDLVAKYLERYLHDDWTLISGYVNNRGEIDKLLVGPSGVFAIEVKYLNGRISCTPNGWWRDKYDNYGNLVNSAIPIADKGGRSPSRQVNEAADQLQKFLDRNLGPGRVRRAVLLSHEKSTIERLDDTSVELICRLMDLDVKGFVGTSQDLSPEGVAKVVKLIEQDHAYYASGLASRGSRKPRPPQFAKAA